MRTPPKRMIIMNMRPRCARALIKINLHYFYRLLLANNAARL